MFTLLLMSVFTLEPLNPHYNEDVGSKSGCVCPSCKNYILSIAILGTTTGILLVLVFGLLVVYHLSKAKPIAAHDSIDSQSDTAPEVPDPEDE